MKKEQIKLSTRLCYKSSYDFFEDAIILRDAVKDKKYDARGRS